MTTSASDRTAQEGNPVVGCGCLLVIIVLIGWLATSCLGGSDDPGTPEAATAPAPPTTSAAPFPTPTSEPTPSASSLAPAGVPAPPVEDRDCSDFSTQAEAQAALTPGDPENLDRDGNGVACEEQFRPPAPAPARPLVAVPAPQPEDDSGGGAVYYKNCAAVRAAGAAPIRRGDPGYARHLDRDGDGEGCAGN